MTIIDIKTNSNSGAISEFNINHFNACFFISILDYFKFNNMNNYVSIKELKSDIYHNYEMYDSDNYEKNKKIKNILLNKSICCVIYKYFNNSSINDDFYELIGDYNNSKYIIKICNFGLGHFEFITTFNNYYFNHTSYSFIKSFNNINFKLNNINFKILNNDLKYYFDSLKLIFKDLTTIINELKTFQLMNYDYNFDLLINYYNNFKAIYEAYYIKYNHIITNIQNCEDLKSYNKYKLSNLNVILLLDDIKEYFLKYNIDITNNDLDIIIDNNLDVIVKHLQNLKSTIKILYNNKSYLIDISFINKKIIDNINILYQLDIKNNNHLNNIIDIFKSE